MSEISSTTQPGHKKIPGVKRSKKLSTKVDLTPMVDLGFLLITFFIFTTTMSKPTAMKMFLPDETGSPTPTKSSQALTLLLGRNDMVYYYEGESPEDPSKIYIANFKKIREIIIDKKHSLKSDKMVVLIKPQKESTYKNTVDALDEMTINDVKHFSVGDITMGEEKLMQIRGNQNP
jgi:biopolymer transport protein ExbD